MPQYYDYLDEKRARELYNQGLCDTDIAAQLGVGSEDVNAWRRKYGLRSNPGRRGKPPKKRPEPRKKSTLSQDAADARAHGMNYGMWMGVKHNQQLKEQARLQKIRPGKT